ncbi:GPI mannosyltransferase 3-like isoform X1 [Artemia franciscana]|uniref:Mannosyltransferase n=1 Tax=Artemia franciscana TaxID=6661 RepID=A0AA88KZU2_ARTSF|nr:hypothetical protein QYM36_014003 [Artemia franciscana]
MKFVYLVVYRWLCSFSSQAQYHPDEYYQTMEFAHGLQFGYGMATWEFQEKIRSCIYPLFISTAFTILEYFQWDNPTTIYFSAYVLQGFVTALGDFLFLKIIKKELGKKAYNWSLFFLMTNWFYIYTGNRALTNTVEMSLLHIAYYFYPWRKEQKGVWFYKVIGVLSFWIRPSGLIFYFTLIILHFYRYPKEFMMSLRFSIPSSILVVTLSIYADYWCYEEFSITPYNFIDFNVLKQASAQFGIERVTFYLYWCCPFMLTHACIPAALFILSRLKFWKRSALTADKILVLNTVFPLIMLSLNPHKEERFIIPIMPTLLVLCGTAVAEFFEYNRFSKQNIRRLQILLVVEILLPNIMGLFYFTYWFMGAMSYGMRDLAYELKTYPNPNLLMLITCFQFRMYSQIHLEMPVKYIDCSDDGFFSNPTEWLKYYYQLAPDAKNHTHILLINAFLYPHMDKFIESQGFTGDVTFIYNNPPATKDTIDLTTLILRRSNL